jgi:hypothetical protein
MSYIPSVITMPRAALRTAGGGVRLGNAADESRKMEERMWAPALWPRRYNPRPVGVNLSSATPGQAPDVIKSRKRRMSSACPG